MATIVQDLFPGPFTLPSSAFAAPDVLNGTNFSVGCLRFDASTEEAAYLGPFRAHNYGSGDLALDLEWYGDSASSGAVVFGASVAAITPNSDATDIEAKAFDTEDTATDTHLGTTGQRLHRVSVTISEANADVLVAGDRVWIKVARKASDGSDTMTGDALLVGACLQYSDT